MSKRLTSSGYGSDTSRVHTRRVVNHIIQSSGNSNIMKKRSKTRSKLSKYSKQSKQSKSSIKCGGSSSGYRASKHGSKHSKTSKSSKTMAGGKRGVNDALAKSRDENFAIINKIRDQLTKQKIKFDNYGAIRSLASSYRTQIVSKNKNIDIDTLVSKAMEIFSKEKNIVDKLNKLKEDGMRKRKEKAAKKAAKRASKMSKVSDE
jgi:hypothetical protein